MGFKLTPDNLPHSFSHAEAEAPLDAYLNGPLAGTPNNCALLMVYAGSESPAFAADKIAALDSQGWKAVRLSFQEDGKVRVSGGAPEAFDDEMSKKIWADAHKDQQSAKKVLFVENLHWANPRAQNLISSIVDPAQAGVGCYASAVITAPLGADISTTVGLGANRIKVEAPEIAPRPRAPKF